MARHDFDELRQQMESHIEHFAKHEREELRRHAEFKIEQEANRAKIDKLCASTESLVDAWEALGGAVKLGIWFGRFIKWASGIAIVSTAITWATRHIG